MHRSEVRIHDVDRRAIDPSVNGHVAWAISGRGTAVAIIVAYMLLDGAVAALTGIQENVEKRVGTRLPAIPRYVESVIVERWRVERRGELIWVHVREKAAAVLGSGSGNGGMQDRRQVTIIAPGNRTEPKPPSAVGAERPVPHRRIGIGP